MYTFFGTSCMYIYIHTHTHTHAQTIHNRVNGSKPPKDMSVISRKLYFHHFFWEVSLSSLLSLLLSLILLLLLLPLLQLLLQLSILLDLALLLKHSGHNDFAVHLKTNVDAIWQLCFTDEAYVRRFPRCKSKATL
jgi:hypothetical protein